MAINVLVNILNALFWVITQSVVVIPDRSFRDNQSFPSSGVKNPKFFQISGRNVQ